MAKNKNLRALAMSAIMGALAAILMIMEISVPFVPSFLKFDLSEAPALITSFAFGPWWGIAVCLVKNLVHLPFTMSQGVGELANFLLGAAFVGTAGALYRHRRTRIGALIGMIIGCAAMSLLQFITNYYIVYPFYTSFMPMDAIMGMYSAIFPFIDNLWEALAVVNLPFTFIKGIVISVICFVIYKPLSPLLKYSKTERQSKK